MNRAPPARFDERHGRRRPMSPFDDRLSQRSGIPVSKRQTQIS